MRKPISRAIEYLKTLPLEMIRERTRIFIFLKLLLTPLFLFVFVVASRPFDIPTQTTSLVEKVSAAFYKSADESAAVVVLIDDANLLEAGLRWPPSAQAWHRFLTQFHFADSATVYLDALITELREFPHRITEAGSNSLSSEEPQRCRPCEGGMRNPIRALSCYFQPAFNFDQADSAEKAAARQATCPLQLTTNSPTPFVAAGANPLLSPLALLGQNLPRCRPPNSAEIGLAQSLMQSDLDPPRAEDTVLSCLAQAATVTPIQWAGTASQYPLVIPTGRVVSDKSDGPILRFEPSVALSMLAGYCDQLNDRLELIPTHVSENGHTVVSRVSPSSLPKGCVDYLNGKLSFDSLTAQADVIDNRHHLVIEWRLTPPAGNHHRGVVGCNRPPPAYQSPIWQATEFFFGALFVNLSSQAAALFTETCPPTNTIMGDMPPKALLADVLTKELLANSAIFIGTNVGFSSDRHETPVHVTVPGIYVHAMAFDNLLTHGVGYNRPAQSLEYLLRVSKTNLWPVDAILSVPAATIFAGLATIFMGLPAVGLYRFRRYAANFPTHQDEVMNFMSAVAVVCIFIAVISVLHLIDNGRLSGMTFDWILLLGIASGAHPAALRALVLDGVAWLFMQPSPRPQLNEKEREKRRSYLLNWAVLIFIKFSILLIPTALIYINRVNVEFYHIAVGLVVGTALLYMWVGITRLKKSFSFK